MLNGMTNTMATSRTGDLYRNIDSIESKCAELISQIDDHLCVSDSRSLICRNDTKIDPIKDADPMFQCCHQSIVDYSSTRKTARKNPNVSNLPRIRAVEEFCQKMTKINEPFPEELLKSFLKPTSFATKCVQTAVELPLRPALKKQVAFNLKVENERQLRRDGNVAVFECSHYSPTHWQNQHKCLASTEDAHAHPESVIDSQPHVHNGVRPPGNSTAADNVRAFLFGSLTKDGKHPRATKYTIVSVKTRRDLRKKPKRGPEKLKMDEQLLRGKRRKKVLLKMDEPVVEQVKNGQIHDKGAVTSLVRVPNIEKLSANMFSQTQNEENYEAEEKEDKIQDRCEAGESFKQPPMDEETERQLATRLLKDSMKFCLKNSLKKDKKVTFSSP